MGNLLNTCNIDSCNKMLKSELDRYKLDTEYKVGMALRGIDVEKLKEFSNTVHETSKITRELSDQYYRIMAKRGKGIVPSVNPSFGKRKTRSRRSRKQKSKSKKQVRKQRRSRSRR
jgi:hypothetical protein